MRELRPRERRRSSSPARSTSSAAQAQPTRTSRKQLADGRRLRGKYLGAGEELEASGTFAVPAHRRGRRRRARAHPARTRDARHAARRVPGRLAARDRRRSRARTRSATRAGGDRRWRGLLETRVRPAEAGTLNAKPGRRAADRPARRARPRAARRSGRWRSPAPTSRPARGSLGRATSPTTTRSRPTSASSSSTARQLGGSSADLGRVAMSSLLRSPTEARGQLSLFNSFFNSPGARGRGEGVDSRERGRADAPACPPPTRRTSPSSAFRRTAARCTSLRSRFASAR